MTARDKTTLKGYFNAGDVPTESNYADLIDSFQDIGAPAGDADTLDGHHASAFAHLTETNIFTIGPQTIETGNSGNKGLILKAFAGQMEPLIRWNSSDGTQLGGIDKDGKITIGPITAGVWHADISISHDYWLPIMTPDVFAAIAINKSFMTNGNADTPTMYGLTSLVNWQSGHYAWNGSLIGFAGRVQVVNVSGGYIPYLTGMVGSVSGYPTIGKEVLRIVGGDFSIIGGKMTITDAISLSATMPTINDGSLGTGYGLKIDPGSKGTGTYTAQYGIYISNVNLGSTVNQAITTNAGKVTFNEGGDSNSDLRVEGSSDSNLLFTDASANRVGIGTVSPNAKLEVKGSSGQTYFPQFRVTADGAGVCTGIELHANHVGSSQQEPSLTYNDSSPALDVYQQRVVLSSFANGAAGTGSKGIVMSLQGSSEGVPDFRIVAGNSLSGTMLFIDTSGQVLVVVNDISVYGYSGWNDCNETWTYASSTTVTLPGDKTGKYTKGTRIRLVQSASWKYFYVVNATYSNPNTTLTLIGGSDYTVANSTITQNCFSRSISPVGFPEVFNWTPTIVGYSSNPTNTVYRFNIVGRKCKITIREATNGTSNDTVTTYTLPVTAATITNATWSGLGTGTDNSVNLTTAIVGLVSSGGTTVAMYKDPAYGSWTNTGSKRMSSIQVEYEI